MKSKCDRKVADIASTFLAWLSLSERQGDDGGRFVVLSIRMLPWDSADINHLRLEMAESAAARDRDE